MRRRDAASGRGRRAGRGAKPVQSAGPEATSELPTMPVASLARRAGPWGFAVLYIGWAYLWWAPILASDTSVWEGRNLVLFLVGGASPLLAGLLLAWLTGGGDRVRDIGRRLVDPRRVSLRWWLVIVGFWPVFNLVMGGAAVLFGVTDQPFAVDVDVLLDPRTLVFQLALAVLFPAAEEVGLRGYYLDRLVERFNLATAALVNGVTWAVWHAPFVLLPGYYDDITFDPQLSWWLPMIVAETVMYVWLWERTNRSILAVLVFHATMNLGGELLGITPDMYPFVLSGHLLVAGVVLLDWRRRSWPSRAVPGPRPAT